MRYELYRATEPNRQVARVGACFAWDRWAAEAYLTHGRFGGSALYKTEVDVDYDEVLDVAKFGETNEFHKFCEALGVDPRDVRESGIYYVPAMWHEGYAWTDEDGTEWDVPSKLRSMGIKWIVFTTDYPTGAEVWLWTGLGDAPVLTPIS